MISLRAGVRSHAGLERSRNEDGYLVGMVLFAVADGMGGHRAGDVASAIVVERLGQLAYRPMLTQDDLRHGLAEANTAILDSAVRHPERDGMGTTVAGLGLVQVLGTDHWTVFNVGDSRVYRFVDGTLVQMTVDHSGAAESVITRALGTDPAPRPDMWVFPPTPGERFLICSDGLTCEVADTAIADVLRDEPSPERAAAFLIDRAIAAGGHDNVTVVVVDHLSVDERDAEHDTHPRPQRAG